MKYLKSYENFKDKPKVGDYVLMRTDSRNIEYRNFLKNNIGQITNMSDYLVTVKYENVPTNLIKLKIFNWNKSDGGFYYHTFNINKMLVFSDTPDDLELKIDTNKYNL